MEQYGVSLNEAMALCCIGGDTLTASVISENTGLSASHTSKVIRSIEEKELIVRNLGDKDKRQMHFTLSDKGHECLEALKANEIEISPPFLTGYISIRALAAFTATARRGAGERGLPKRSR